MNVLTRKYGPLPGWAWALGVAGGVWFASRLRSATPRSPDAAPTGPSPYADPIGGGVGPPPGQPTIINIHNPGGGSTTPPCPSGSYPIGGPKCPPGTAGVQMLSPYRHCYQCKPTTTTATARAPLTYAPRVEPVAVKVTAARAAP